MKIVEAFGFVTIIFDAQWKAVVAMLSLVTIGYVVGRLHGYQMTNLPRPYYDKALKALQEAHNACFKHPERDVLGMSHGPFSGVNETLGIVTELEERLRWYETLFKR